MAPVPVSHLREQLPASGWKDCSTARSWWKCCRHWGQPWLIPLDLHLSDHRYFRDQGRTAKAVLLSVPNHTQAA